MRYLKIYEDFKDINSICREYGIENYTIVDGKLNVDGDVHLSNRGLTKLPISKIANNPFNSNENRRISKIENEPIKQSIVTIDKETKETWRDIVGNL